MLLLSHDSLHHIKVLLLSDDPLELEDVSVVLRVTLFSHRALCDRLLALDIHPCSTVGRSGAVLLQLHLHLVVEVLDLGLASQFHHFLHLDLIIAKVVSVLDNLILFLIHFLHVLFVYLVTHELLHQIVMVLECTKLSIRYVELIDH